jgi:hypothetical protein
MATAWYKRFIPGRKETAMKNDDNLSRPFKIPRGAPAGWSGGKRGAPKEAAPLPEEWRQLYDEADAFRALACWEWMTDEDIFAVVSPEDGTEGYACVLGNAKEEFGMALYLGAEGLRGYEMTVEGAFDGESAREIVMAQRCLVLTFGGKEFLQKEDLDVIKKLGKSFGGAAWPSFRSYRPRYLPWFLTGAEARLLSHALREARGIGVRFRENRSLLDPRGDLAILARVPVREGENLRWEDRWIGPPAPTQKPPLALDELRARRLLASAQRGAYTLEVGTFTHPRPVQDEPGGRPYFASILLAVETKSGIILGCGPRAPYEVDAVLLDDLLGAMEDARALPGQIAVKDEETRRLLLPLATALDVPVAVKRKLGALDEAIDSLRSFTSGRRKMGKGRGGRGRPKNRRRKK